VVVEDLNKVPFFTPLWTEAPVALLVHHLFGATAFQEASFPLAAATWLLERPVPRLFHGRATVAVSESTRADLVQRGMNPERIEVIPNGIELDAFSPSPEGTRFEVPTVLYLGRLKRYKRVDLVLQAAAEMKRRGVTFRVLVAGTGDHRPQLVRLTNQLGLDDRVDFLGFVSEEEKLNLFRRSWVHVLTSPKEGWGIANMEAAASGTPTVASDAPGLRDSVLHERTGFLVRHGDVSTLADRIGQILTDEGLRDALGGEARRFAEGFSWDQSAEAMEAFLHRVVGVSTHD
jgi:glycosyltransferase involved in cell wall biosynthesis